MAEYFDDAWNKVKQFFKKDQVIMALQISALVIVSFVLLISFILFVKFVKEEISTLILDKQCEDDNNIALGKVGRILERYSDNLIPDDLIPDDLMPPVSYPPPVYYLQEYSDSSL